MTKYDKNKFVRKKMRPKGGGTDYVSYFDCDSDSIISMPFPLKIHDLKKNKRNGQNLK